MTERISGTPDSIINTKYAQKIGYKQNKLEQSIKPGNYKNLWIAGKSVQFINEIHPVKTIIQKFKTELQKSIPENTFR
ncbi:MAG: hypothetical protein GXO50_08475 [Chlorobi bacterium]|nr:hypothetical protein [Chlorobiota bacterium]